MTIICELGFEEPDPKNPKYSLREVDIYAIVPYAQKRASPETRSHRLTLRKNLETGKFEVYRFYYDTKEVEVAYEGDFEGALNFANRERFRYWRDLGVRERDVPCRHKHPQIDMFFCPKRGW